MWYDTTPRRQRPLSKTDLRRKLEVEPVFPNRTPQSRTSRTNPENPLHTAYCKYIGTNPDPPGPQNTENGARYYTENQHQRENEYTPKHQKPLSNIDLRRRKLIGVPDISDQKPRSSGPQKMAPNCSTEYRHHSLNTSGEHTRQDTNKPKNWWFPPEEEEMEILSKDDISTDKCEGNESTEEEGM